MISPDPRSIAKQRAALASVVASLVMTLGKLVVGLMTGSLGILSEAAHSLLDLGATLITYFAVRVSDLPPDQDHPYGHGKIESLAALSETALLLLTSIGIVWQAVKRLISGVSNVEVTWWAAGVIAASIAIDIFRSRALAKLAKSTRSQALEADALHFSSDILSSSVVLVGLGFVAMGYKTADSLAAIGVAIFVSRAAWQMGRRTIDTLIDTAPEGIAELVRTIALRTSGIVDLGRVRARVIGPSTQIELEIGVNRRLSLDRVGEVKQSAIDRICLALPDAEVSVSTFPVALSDETMRDRILMIAAYGGHPVHHITVQHLGEALSISLDIEVDRTHSLADASRQARDLEAAIVAEVGGIVEVITHIEPLMLDELNSAPASPALVRDIEHAIQDIAADMPRVLNTNDVCVRNDISGLFISFGCVFAPDENVEFVHDTVSRIEAELRQRFGPYRIVTHAEPVGESA